MGGLLDLAGAWCSSIGTKLAPGWLNSVWCGMAEGMNRLRAPTEHPGWLNAYRVPRTKFDAALQTLIEIPNRVKRDGRYARMVAALDGAATIGQIRHWRAGRRRVPQWVKDLLAKKLADRAERSAKAKDDAEAA